MPSTLFDDPLPDTVGTTPCSECGAPVKVRFADLGSGLYFCAGDRCGSLEHVCVCGSLNVGRIPNIFFDKLEALIKQGVAIEIGDAPGGDKIAQRYLAGRGYRSVTVWHIGNAPRNNIGSWPTRAIRGT